MDRMLNSRDSRLIKAIWRRRSIANLLDEVAFLPTGQAWQKPDRKLPAAEDRYLG
jgi:hypothetical protein